MCGAPVFVDRNSSTATATASGQPPTGQPANGKRLRPTATGTAGNSLLRRLH